ncbi:MAG: META domain-containing protein [Bacteroidales bacterium]|nr:META domain-containing protein [Bacteroidales bacterium]
MKKIIFFFVLFFVFASCSILNNNSENKTTDSDAQSVFGVEWKLKKIGNKVMKYSEENETITLLMTSEPENVSGFSACNRYFGKFIYKKGKLTFKDMASTAMLCPDQTMDLEKRYLTQLEKVNNFLLTEDGELHLRKDEKILLIFVQ